MSTIIQELERAQLRDVPRFKAGDTVRVHFRVIEGTRQRIQVFEGIVIKRQGAGARETFTVRKNSFGVGVERTFPLHSPKIDKIDVAAIGDVHRAKPSITCAARSARRLASASFSPAVAGLRPASCCRIPQTPGRWPFPTMGANRPRGYPRFRGAENRQEAAGIRPAAGSPDSVAGADEAGRGPLAGPLVVAGVLLDLDRLRDHRVRPLGFLNDSKQVAPELRAELYRTVLACATRVSVRVFPPSR